MMLCMPSYGRISLLLQGMLGMITEHDVGDMQASCRVILMPTSISSVSIITVLHPDASKEVAEIHCLAVLRRPCLLRRRPP